ncbi:MAG: hypothetical protein R6V42_08740, partial [Orrella sp.]
ASSEYDLARPTLMYFKNAHRGVIAGFDDFITEFVSEDSLGRGGYNNERGLTVLPAAKLKETQANVAAGKKFSM